MDEDLEIHIGADASQVEGGARNAQAAINKVTREAGALDKAFRNLKSSLDPIFSAQTRYNEALANSERLLKAGRIDESEYAASVSAATAALQKRAAQQLKGTEVAVNAARAGRAAEVARTAELEAGTAATIAAAKVSATERAAEEARLTSVAATEAKNRAAIAVDEAKAKLEAVKQSIASSAGAQQRDPRTGRFLSSGALAAQQAADQAEAEEQVRLAQLDLTTTSQKSRNAQRVMTTREEAARRAVVAEKSFAAAAVASSQISISATTAALEAQALLTAAEEAAGAAAITAAEEQASADALITKATQEKAKAAAAEVETSKKATAAAKEKAKADREAAIESKRAAASDLELEKAERLRAAAANRIRASVDPVFAAQQRYQQAIGGIQSLTASGHLDSGTAQKASAAAQKELNEALSAGTKVAVNNRTAYESLVLVHEGLQRRWSRMAGSALILGQAIAGDAASAGLMAAAFSPVGIAILAAVAAIGTFTVASIQGQQQIDHYNQALAVTGNFAGKTAGQMDEAAHRIGAATNTGIGMAEKSFQQLTASGRVSGQTMNNMVEIISRLQELTHQKAETITEDMVKMADDPVAAMRKLQDQYHFLTPAQEEHIRNLQEEGNKTQAASVLSDAFVNKLRDETVHLQGLSGALHDASVWLGNFWQGLMDIGKAPDPSQGALNKLNQEIAKTKALINSGDQSEDRLTRLQRLTAMERDAASIKAKLDSDGAANKKATLTKEHDDNLAALDQLEATTRTSHAKMLREQQAWRTETQAILANPYSTAEDKADAQFRLSHAAQTDAAIAKKFDRGDTSSGTGTGPSIVQKWEEQLHEAEIQSNNFFQDQQSDELKFWQDKLTKVTRGSKDWVQVQTKVYDLQKSLARSAYQDDLSALKDKVDESKGSLLDEGVAWSDYLSRVKSVMGETSKEYIAAQKEFRAAQAEMAAFQGKQLAVQEKQAEQPINRADNAQKTGFESTSSNIDYEKKSGIINDLQAAQQHRALLNAQVDEERDFEDTIYNLKKEELQKELSLPGQAKEKIAEIQGQIEELTQTHEDKLAEIRNKSLLDYQKNTQETTDAIMQKYRTMADTITSSISSSFQGLWSRTTTWRQAALNLADSIVYKFFDMGAEIVKNWAVAMIQTAVSTKVAAAAQVATTAAAQTTMTAATVAGNTTRTTAETAYTGKSILMSISRSVVHVTHEAIKTAATVAGVTYRLVVETIAFAKSMAMSAISMIAQVTHYAVIAAAGAYAALAGIPIIGPFIAPAAAVAALAAVVGFISSAEGGWDRVPQDGMVTELHKDEMVLPAWIANPFRDGLRSRSSSGLFANTASVGGGVRESTVNNVAGHNFTYAPQTNHANTSWDTLVAKEGSNMRRWFYNQIRNGELRKPR